MDNLKTPTAAPHVVRFYVREVYGAPALYVAGDVPRRIISELTGKKTISLQDIDNLRALGVRVEQVENPDAARIGAQIWGRQARAR